MTKRSFTNTNLSKAFKILGRVHTQRHRAQPKSGMNKAEAQYASYLSHHPDVVSWKHEPLSLWLAKDCRFIPDFAVEYKDGSLTLADVKALWSHGKPGVEDDALVKLKLAGQMYGCWFQVVMTWWDKTTGKWEERVFDHILGTNKELG